MLELRVSKSKWLQQPSVSLNHIPCWFKKPVVMGISFPGTGSLGWVPGVEIGPLAPQRAPQQMKYPSRFLRDTCGYRISPPTSLCLLPVSLWLLFYILSYKTSVMLDIWWFWMMIILEFCCTFDVVWEAQNTSFIDAAILSRTLIQTSLFYGFWFNLFNSLSGFNYYYSHFT